MYIEKTEERKKVTVGCMETEKQNKTQVTQFSDSKSKSLQSYSNLVQPQK